jgi:hypothetical protein
MPRPSHPLRSDLCFSVEFVTLCIFYVEELLHHAQPQAGDHPLLFVHDCYLLYAHLLPHLEALLQPQSDELMCHPPDPLGSAHLLSAGSKYSGCRKERLSNVIHPCVESLYLYEVTSTPPPHPRPPGRYRARRAV